MNRPSGCQLALRTNVHVPYSGKFSRVQNFAESPLRAPEEIFAVLIFVAPTHTGRQGAIDIVLAAIFTEGDLPANIAKFCITRKFVYTTEEISLIKTPELTL